MQHSEISVWERVKCFFGFKQTCERDDQQHVMSEEELLDQTLDDSFPASDPPGHFSKSVEDFKSHSS